MKKDIEDEHEIWKDVAGYEGHYQVSNLGRVRGLDRFVPKCNKKSLHRRAKSSQGLFLGVCGRREKYERNGKDK